METWKNPQTTVWNSSVAHSKRTFFFYLISIFLSFRVINAFPFMAKSDSVRIRQSYCALTAALPISYSQAPIDVCRVTGVGGASTGRCVGVLGSRARSGVIARGWEQPIDQRTPAGSFRRKKLKDRPLCSPERAGELAARPLRFASRSSRAEERFARYTRAMDYNWPRVERRVTTVP